MRYLDSANRAELVQIKATELTSNHLYLERIIVQTI